VLSFVGELEAHRFELGEVEIRKVRLEKLLRFLVGGHLRDLPLHIVVSPSHACIER